VTGHYEPTTILSGGQGQPTIVVRDHGWRAQVEAEKRARQDEEIKATVAGIRRAGEVRKRAPRPSLAELADGMRANAALAAERREAPERITRQLDATEAIVQAMAARTPAEPAPVMRRGRPVSPAQLAYEDAQLAHKMRQDRPAGGGCGYCSTCRGGHPEWCLQR
jgi:hypothetical protein